MKYMPKKILTLLVVALLLPVTPVIAQVAPIPGSITFDVPYSLIQSWVTNGKLVLPDNTANMNRQQILALQYFLKSHTYPIEATGVLDKSTHDALSRLQNGNTTILNESTKLGINKLLAYLYCPEGQNSISTPDFRLKNVNKSRVLPNSYIPNNLVLETSEQFLSAGPVCLESETYSALTIMYHDAQKENIDLFVTSSFRSEDSQDYLLKVMIGRHGDYAYKIVALPGLSEHNLGTSLDFTGYQNGKRVPLVGSRQFAWLEKNASKYGFVNSYPTGKEHVTGFRAEPWHWRYVGIPVATKVTNDKITLAEFFDKYKVSFNKAMENSGRAFGNLLINNAEIGG